MNGTPVKGIRDWVPPLIGAAFMLVALAILAAYCVRVSSEQPLPAATPTAAPVATQTMTPAPTVTAYVSVPVVPTWTTVQTSTPEPAATSTPDVLLVDVPTMRPVSTPVHPNAPYQVPGRRP